MIREPGTPSARFVRDAEQFGAHIGEIRRAHYADRWRRRFWWTVNGVLVPAVLVPTAIYGLGFSVAKPPDTPSLFGVLFVMSISCARGGIIGGVVALVLTACAVGWEMLDDHPLSDHKLWLWFMLALLGYASVLALLYFRAPDRTPIVPPPSSSPNRRGSAFVRKRLHALRWRRSRFDGNRSIRHTSAPALELEPVGSEPKREMPQEYVRRYDRLFRGNRPRLARYVP